MTSSGRVLTNLSFNDLAETAATALIPDVDVSSRSTEPSKTNQTVLSVRSTSSFLFN